MEPEAKLSLPVVFLGADASLAERLGGCYARIAWDAEYRIAPTFLAAPAGAWSATVPERGRGLVYVEITDAGTEGESQLIRALADRNPSLQIVLLADEDVDYFRIARDFHIGKVIKKGRFD
jgi:hypothetical protein